MSDPSLLADLAALVAGHAEALRHDAGTLARLTGHCAWEGRAARRFRADAAPVLRQLQLTSVHLDDVADLIRQHSR